MDKVLTISEVAQKLGVTEWTVRRWDKIGKLKAIRTPGGHRRYLEIDINRMLYSPSSPTDNASSRKTHNQEEP